MGHIYSVNPKKIYLSDTPISLRTLGCTVEPYSFELILGVSKRLGIIITEPEIDRIAGRIHNSANNVEDLTNILCEEISAAEEAQTVNGVDINDLEKEIKTTKSSEWILPAGIMALCFAFMESIAILEEGKSIFTLSSIISLLIVVGISFLVVFVIGMVTTRLLSLLSNKKPNNSKIKGKIIQLDVIREVADNSFDKRYVYCLIIEMHHKQYHEKILKKYEPLPFISIGNLDSDEMPCFAEVANLLKKMARAVLK